MPEQLSHPRSWSLTLLERELKKAAGSPPLSLARMRALRWLAELEPAEVELLWGRAVGLSWECLAAERDDVNPRTIAHRLYLPALERLKTVATLDAFDRIALTCSTAIRDAGNRLEQRFDTLETKTPSIERAA